MLSKTLKKKQKKKMAELASVTIENDFGSNGTNITWWDLLF